MATTKKANTAKKNVDPDDVITEKMFEHARKMGYIDDNGMPTGKNGFKTKTAVKKPAAKKK